MADKKFPVKRANLMRVRRQIGDHLGNLDGALQDHLADVDNPHDTTFLKLGDNPPNTSRLILL